LYSLLAPITLTPAVTANGHSLVAVQFLDNSSLLAQTFAAPWSFTWTNASAVAGRRHRDDFGRRQRTQRRLLHAGRRHAQRHEGQVRIRLSNAQRQRR